MVAALRRELPDAMFEVPQGGYYVWLTLPEASTAIASLALALDGGVTVLAGQQVLRELRCAASEEPPPHRLQPRDHGRGRQRHPQPRDRVSRDDRHAPRYRRMNRSRMKDVLGIRGVVAERGQRAQGFVTIGETASGPIQLPLVIVNGVDDGPMLCLTAGVHATEYAPIDAVLRIIQSLRPDDAARRRHRRAGRQPANVRQSHGLRVAARRSQSEQGRAGRADGSISETSRERPAR